MKIRHWKFGSEHGALGGYRAMFIMSATLHATHKVIIRPADGDEITVRLIPMSGGCWFLVGPLQSNPAIGIIEAQIAHEAIDHGKTGGLCTYAGGSWSSHLITEDGEMPEWMPIIRELQKL